MLTDCHADHYAKLRAAGHGGEFYEDPDFDLDEILKRLEEEDEQRIAASNSNWETVEEIDLTKVPIDEP